jgi:archaellum component FlaC
LKDKIEQLVQEELEKATEKFKPFNSPHEGYAVILEEFEELEDEMRNIKRDLNNLWDSIKDDDRSYQPLDTMEIYNDSIKAIQEAIQVAAMAKRYLKDICGGE